MKKHGVKEIKRKVGRPKKISIDKKIHDLLKKPKIKKEPVKELEIRKIDHIAYIIYAILVAIIIETIVIGRIR
jgi:hypothetical protein